MRTAADSRSTRSSSHWSSAIALDRINATLSLDEDITSVKGVSTNRRPLLAKLGVRSVRDLLAHYPRRYIDLTNITDIASAAIGDVCTIQGTIADVKVKRPRRNLSIIEMPIQDATGVLMVTIFNQIWLAKKFKAGDGIAVTGKVAFDYGFKKMVNPYIEVTDGMPIEARVLPVHPATEKLTAAVIRNIMAEGLSKVSGLHDAIPEPIRVKRHLMSKHNALRNIHFPTDMQEAVSARMRLTYEEILYLEVFLMRQANERSKYGSPTAHVTDGAKLAALRASIPFALTGDQKRAIGQLLEVMARPLAANHMVLGDVGTGKTIVAAHGIAASVDSGGQAALLAPTEVLANQHFSTLGRQLDEVGIRSALLTGSVPREERAGILAELANGDIDVLIGTHAIFEDDIEFKDLTLAIIDEQQRFGVSQRARLLNKGSAPDALYLTATPIPRTLALAIFGNLTLSYIKERPNASTTRSTSVLPKGLRGNAYDAAREALARGEQVYVICPLIGVSSDKGDDADDVREDDVEFHPDVSIDDMAAFDEENPVAAEDEARFLQAKVFPEYKVGLLHGSMPSDKKKEVMADFVAGEIDVLVSTTVIEVGVDVAGATTMIIEDADRFGLSQLHQIRGRVGRGDKAAQVFLISSSKRDEALYRLSALERSDDGFELAEYDLALRREGDVLGSRQSGANNLKLVNIIKDAKLIEWAHEDAREIVDADPDLDAPDHKALKREIGIVFKDEMTTFSG